MSYTIFYDKQFIKLKDNLFIPYTLMGDNNCCDVYNNRRSRDWWPIKINQKIAASKEEMIKYCQDHRQDLIDRNKEAIKKYDDWDVYDDKSFGYFSGLAIRGTTYSTTYGMYEGWFKTGCDKALTPQQLLDEGVNLYVTLGYCSKEFEQSIAEKNGGTPFCEKFTTYEEFKNLIKKGKELVEEDNENLLAVASTGLWEENPKNFRRKYFPAKKNRKAPEEVDHYYTVLIKRTNSENFEYFRRFSRKYYFYFQTRPYLKFKTQKEAENKVKYITKKGYIAKTKLIQERAWL